VPSTPASPRNMDSTKSSIHWTPSNDAASAYIKSQAHAGWTLIRSRYDDGGYSGGSTDRPDLQRLLDDIRAGSLMSLSSTRSIA